MKEFGLIPYSGRYRRKMYKDNQDKVTGRILDIGAGGDELSAMYDDFPHVDEYIATDVTTGKFLDIRCDGKNLPFASNTFDTVIVSDVLEHVETVGVANLIQEGHRVLKDGGRLLMTTPFLFPMHQEPHDYQRFTELGLENLLTSNGFSKVNTKRLGTYTEHLLELLYLPFRSVTVFLNRKWLGWCFLPIHIIGVVIGNINRKILELINGEHPWKDDYYLLTFVEGVK